MSYWSFERDFTVLRNKLRLSKLEDDEYKIIIYIERFILEYGKQAFKDTLKSLETADEKEEIEILADTLQTEKQLKNLFIYGHSRQSRENI